MTTFDYFLRKYFGARGKRLVRTLVVCVVVYSGLAETEWCVAISPFVLCLMTSVFSGGAMLRALAAADGQAELRHLLMLPENARDIVRGYIGALALYTLASDPACARRCLGFSACRSAQQPLWKARAAFPHAPLFSTPSLHA